MGKHWSKKSKLISRKADLEPTGRPHSEELARASWCPGVGRHRTHLVNTPDSPGSPDSWERQTLRFL